MNLGFFITLDVELKNTYVWGFFGWACKFSVSIFWKEAMHRIHSGSFFSTDSCEIFLFKVEGQGRCLCSFLMLRAESTHRNKPLQPAGSSSKPCARVPRAGRGETPRAGSRAGGKGLPWTNKVGKSCSLVFCRTSQLDSGKSAVKVALGNAKSRGCPLNGSR